MKTGKSVIKTAEKDCSQTPWYLIRALERIAGRKFDLDVCALGATAKADRYYSLDERGENCLELDWTTLNWCNPPFSNITPFVEKAAEQARCGRTTYMIMPASPETGYVRLAKSLADTIIEMPYRIQFTRANGEPFLDGKGKPQSPQFSCLIAVFTPLGLHTGRARHIEIDFREMMK